MATENKTQKTKASVAAFLAAVEDPRRRKDCQTVAKLMKKATGKSGAMWGTSIVGFGDVRIRGASREVDWFLVGFSPRKAGLTLYLGFNSPPSRRSSRSSAGTSAAAAACTCRRSRTWT